MDKELLRSQEIKDFRENDPEAKKSFIYPSDVWEYDLTRNEKEALIHYYYWLCNDDPLFPSYNLISLDLSIKPARVKKAIEGLQHKGLIPGDLNG